MLADVLAYRERRRDAPSDRAKSALDYLSAHTQTPYGNAFMDNNTLVGDGTQRVYAFTSFPEITARFMSGVTGSAIDEIKRLYAWMATHDPGTTDWEGIGAGGSQYEGLYTSDAHGWSTGGCVGRADGAVHPVRDCGVFDGRRIARRRRGLGW